MNDNITKPDFLKITQIMLQGGAITDRGIASVLEDMFYKGYHLGRVYPELVDTRTATDDWKVL